MANALPSGLVDVIVAGHTHKGIAHIVHGIPIIESYSYGRAFGRVDLTLDRTTHRVTGVHVFPPHDLCRPANAPVGSCNPGDYAGRSVVPQDDVAQAIAPWMARAKTLQSHDLGVHLDTPIPRNYDHESALGNLLADLMLEARPHADAAVVNGGALRASLPAGNLTYGEMYEAFPFDNRFATVDLTGAQLRALIVHNLQSDKGFLSIAGVKATARCRHGQLVVQVLRKNGRPIGDHAHVTLIASDFLATGGDSLFSTLGADHIHIAGEGIRDVLVHELETRGGTLRADQLVDPAHPRVRYEGDRPLRCGVTPAAPRANGAPPVHAAPPVHVAPRAHAHGG